MSPQEVLPFTEGNKHSHFLYVCLSNEHTVNSPNCNSRFLSYIFQCWNWIGSCMTWRQIPMWPTRLQRLMLVFLSRWDSLQGERILPCVWLRSPGAHHALHLQHRWKRSLIHLPLSEWAVPPWGPWIVRRVNKKSAHLTAACVCLLRSWHMDVDGICPLKDYCV